VGVLEGDGLLAEGVEEHLAGARVRVRVRVRARVRVRVRLRLRLLLGARGRVIVSSDCVAAAGV